VTFVEEAGGEDARFLPRIAPRVDLLQQAAHGAPIIVVVHQEGGQVRPTGGRGVSERSIHRLSIIPSKYSHNPINLLLFSLCLVAVCQSFSIYFSFFIQ
jgi:hypothetical protein